MDFERVLTSLVTAFEQARIRYAAIGGFALGVLGVPRATMDLDCLVHRDDLEAVHRIFGELGYARLARTEHASHYVHRDSQWGRIDLLHALRKYSLNMLERARAYPIFNGQHTIKVLEPEDLVGYKIQAMANNPLRRKHEEADIETVMMRFGRALDWNRIQEYYDLFELNEEGRQLRERFGHAQ